MLRKSFLAVLLFVSAGLLPASAQRWTMDPAGHGIVWKVGSDIPHADHIEMSGQRMACVLRWGVGADSAFRLERSLVFPLLRTVPNNTHASLMFRLATDIPALLAIDGLALQAERVDTVAIDGGLEVRSRWYTGGHNIGAARTGAAGPAIAMTRRIFPSRELPVLCERYVVRNIARRRLTVYVPEFSQRFETDPDKGVEGSYCVRADLAGSGRYSLAPGDSLCFDAVFQAGRAGDGPLMPDVAAEYAARMDFVRRDIDAALVLETPDPVIDRLFRFAKLRAAESIILTRGGYMHAPGGESYYAAIWANDQAEYVNPFFPFLGYDIGNASAFNAFRHFARFMNPGYEPLPSSIIAEGDDVWNGAGDRGDAAMIAYGAARYALARGDRTEAEALWPLVTWCLEYCRRQLTPEGIVSSDSDELEGRFPAGRANLCTSSLYYDALLSAAALGRELGAPRSETARYGRQARELAEAVERCFGAVDLHAADRRAGRPGPHGGNGRGAARPRTAHRRRTADRAGQCYLLGPLDALCPARHLPGRTGRPGHRVPPQLLRAPPAGRARPLSDRGVARRVAAPPIGRERTLLPDHHRGPFRHSARRVPVVRPDPFAA